ncbi:MAG: TPM domain-containing protein [Desulfovibrionaceae bacterium]
MVQRILRPAAPGLVLGALLLAALAATALALDVPPLKGRVNDYADMISPQAEQQLTAMLADLERTDSTQIAILTIPSLEGDSLEAFSIRAAEKWGLGQKKEDNGALLLVSKADRKIRIEVGYGLEGRLTDVMSGAIIDNVITPDFKAGKIDQGFLQGAQAMVKAVRGEYTAPPPKTSPRGESGGAGLFFLVIIALFLFSGLGRMFSGRRRRGSGSGLGWLLLLGMLAGGSHRGGGGGFGGGGFSGGGGGFGGGGASGGW